MTVQIPQPSTYHNNYTEYWGSKLSLHHMGGQNTSFGKGGEGEAGYSA